MRFAWPEGEPGTLRAGAVASARSVNDKEVLDDSHQDALGADIELPAGLPPTLDVRFADRVALLARTDEKTADLKLSNAQSGTRPAEALRMELGNSRRQPAGRMFWFARKRFAGS